MGISKKALEELNKSRETSVEALKPIKEAIVQIALSKDFNKLKAVSEEALVNTTVSSLTYSTLQKLIETGVLKSASSAKLRTFAQELHQCYHPSNVASLPDRVIRDLIAENWKEMLPMFPLEGTVVTFGGTRVNRANTAFSMVVENSKELRRYLRVCQRSLPTNMGLMYTPLPIALEPMQQKMWKHQFVPTHSRSNSSLASCNSLWSCNDKELQRLYSVFFSEVAWVLRNWASMTMVRSFYHSHHTLSTTIEIAKQRTLQSIFTGAFPGRQNHQDYQVQLPNRNAEFQTLSGGANPLEAKRQIYPRILVNLSADSCVTLMPMFSPIYANLAKSNRTAADKSAIDSSEIVRSLEAPIPFLLVSLEYVPNRAYVDNRGVARSATLDNLHYMGFKSFEHLFSTAGVKMDQVIAKSLLKGGITLAETSFLQNLRQELRLPLLDTQGVIGDTGLRSTISRGMVGSPERIVGALTKVATIFGTLQRRNLWTTLLKHQQNPRP